MRVALCDGRREGADLPDPARFDEVRDMRARFPDAGLARVDLARFGDAWIADESRQVTGSFKVRGALVALDARKKAGATRIVAASAGNHGAGVAWAARALGLEALVYVPRSAAEKKRARIVAAGARLVVVESDHYDDAEAEGMRVAKETGTPFVSAYDDLDVILGNGVSLGLEIAAALGKEPDALLVPIGGGGLATGLACALPKTRVWGVQSEASPAFAMSLARGAAVERLIEDVPTWAEALEGGIARNAFARARAVLAGVVVVSEDAIARAMTHAHRVLRTTLEGSAAAALAPVLEGLPAPIHGEIVVVATGGNVDPARLDAAMASIAPRA